MYDCMRAVVDVFVDDVREGSVACAIACAIIDVLF